MHAPTLRSGELVGLNVDLACGLVECNGVVTGLEEDHVVVVAAVLAEKVLAFLYLSKTLIGIPVACGYDTAAHVIALRYVDGDGVDSAGLFHLKLAVGVVPAVPGAYEDESVEAYEAVYFGVIGGESCLQLFIVLGVLDVVCKSIGKTPPCAGDVALHVSVLSLVIYGYELRAVLYEIAVLSVLVGRSPCELLASFELSFLAGEELGQLVDGSCLLGIRLRLYSEELAALEGAHLIGLSVDGEGRQLGYSEVVLEDALCGVVIPGTGYNCGSAGAERGYVGILNVALGVLQEVHGLGGSESLVGVEVVVEAGVYQPELLRFMTKFFPAASQAATIFSRLLASSSEMTLLS